MAGSSDRNRVSRRKLLLGAGAAGATALAGCSGGNGGGLSGSVKVAGSSTVYPISSAFAEEFQKKHSNVDISVSSTGTGAGFSNYFCVGKTDINDASRPIKDSEVQKCKSNDVNPVEFQIATDALTVVAHPEADFLDCLSFDELREIWGPGNPPQKWSDVRSEWPDKTMNLYGPSSASGTFDFFTEHVMGEEGKHRSDYQGTEKDNVIVQGVSGDKYAMGYLGFAYYVDNKDKLKGVPIKSPDSGNCVKPTFESAKAGKYPLSRPLFIYVAKESLKEKAVREFVEYYLKNSSSEIVRQVGYVPVTEETKQQNLDKFDKAVSEVTK